ncbi:MAG: transglutaminase, partial [Staphylothermus sp.]|nr:transglutaminase [Staphylothermus sp.]
GYYHYVFLGGGGHGWVAVYIPPWEWIRVDLTIGTGKGIGHIRGAAYYIFPTVLIGKIVLEDYAVQSADYTEEIILKKIKYDLILEVIKYNSTQK